jgi:hypothetical protein
MHGQLRFRLADAPLGRGELCPLQGAQPRCEPAVDPPLTPPTLDRLLADPKVARHVLYLASGGHQVDHSPPELCRIPASARSTLSAHALFLSKQQRISPEFGLL